jgi:putative nucleotidyltransferase with HDIG domain
MGKKILVVDDEKGMRLVLRDVLNKKGHSVLEAGDGQLALDVLENTEVDLIIADIKMPNMDGVQLLQSVRSTKQIPVILMTGFTDVIETQQAFSSGASDFLTKPFKYEDVLAAVERVLNSKIPTAEDNERDMDGEYYRIPIDEFVSGDQLNVSVYVRLSNKRYIRVSHKGDAIPLERVEQYKQRGLFYLYAKNEDFANLVGFNLHVSKVAMKAKIPLEKKVSFLRYTTETVLEEIMVQGVDIKSFEHAKECTRSCVSLVAESDSLLELLTLLNSHANWIYAHSLGVSLYSAMIAKKLGWKSQVNTFKLTMAGLFHDIGKKEINTYILEKHRPLLTKEEHDMYESHPERGRLILESIKEIPEDVIKVAYEHHEDCIGRGYPRQIKKHYIHPFAKIVSVADQFCNYALKSPHSRGCNAQEALIKIGILSEQLDLDALNALENICASSEV